MGIDAINIVFYSPLLQVARWQGQTTHINLKDSFADLANVFLEINIIPIFKNETLNEFIGYNQTPIFFYNKTISINAFATISCIK